MDLNIWFRVDAATWIGIGHVMRCLTLADALASEGARCGFICRDHKGHLGELIKGRGHRLTLLVSRGPTSHVSYIDEATPTHAHWLNATADLDAHQSVQVLADENPDWLVVDHYALDYRWERAVRPHCRKLMVIDDLADRLHDCDVLLDQTYARNRVVYRGLVPTSCTLLCGSRYALLRPEFDVQRGSSLERRQAKNFKIDRIMITMGGVDADNVTGKVLDVLAEMTLPKSLVINVVLGGSAPWLDKVRDQVSELPYQMELCVDATNMASLMSQADLAIGAAGATSWERCCLGLPAIMIILAENQRLAGSELQREGAAQVLEYINDIPAKLPPLLDELISNGDLSMSDMSRKASEIVDGQGVRRVADVMRGLT
ncbi:MAG: UDP-2,4-diacetamido-2,4,6-trideoxy-beta-L-altropyranose hydrolase [Pseudoalteromonas distincta]